MYSGVSIIKNDRERDPSAWHGHSLSRSPSLSLSVYTSDTFGSRLTTQPLEAAVAGRQAGEEEINIIEYSKWSRGGIGNWQKLRRGQENNRFTPDN